MKLSVYFTVCFVLCMIFHVRVSFGQPNDFVADVDVPAMLLIKAAFRIDNVTWPGDRPLCNWTGVNCNAINGPDRYRVDQLTLRGGLLNSSTAAAVVIPPEIAHLNALQLISLDYFNLTGSNISTVFLNTSLQQLLLSDNIYDGELPQVPVGSLFKFVFINNTLVKPQQLPDWSNNSQLTTLVIQQTSRTQGLTGPLNDIKFLPLNVLILENVPLDTPFPGWINTIKSLQHLVITGAGLIGPIPSSISQLALSSLDLSNNALDKKLPSRLPTPLQTLDLSDNFIEGNVSALFLLLNLQNCSITNNYFDCSNASFVCCENYVNRTTPPTTSTTLTSSSTLSSSTLSPTTSPTSSTPSTTSTTSTTSTSVCTSNIQTFAATAVCIEGTWQITGTVVNDGELTIGKDNVFIISGDYVQQSTSTLEVDQGASSLVPLQASGNAFLNGSLLLKFTEDLTQKSINITLIEASNVTGQFSAIDAQSSQRCRKLAVRPIYGSTQVLMEVTSQNTCSSSQKQKIGIIVGASLAGLVIIVILIAIFLFLYRRKVGSLRFRLQSPSELPRSSSAEALDQLSN